MGFFMLIWQCIIFYDLILDENHWIVKNESSLNINCKTGRIFILSSGAHQILTIMSDGFS
jgi:hypothetical protein